MIVFYSTVRVSIDTSVSGIRGTISNILVQSLFSSPSVTIKSLIERYRPLKTLSRLKGNSLALLYSNIIFFIGNISFRVGLYREVKYYLPIGVTPARSIR